MNRELKFKRYYQHDETGRITYILWGNINNNDESVTDFSVFKSPSTISRWHPIADCQFIEMKDIKNEDIYEGDIMMLQDIICAINFLDGAFQMRTNNNQGRSDAVQSRLKYFKKIGNIYENPELLK